MHRSRGAAEVVALRTEFRFCLGSRANMQKRILGRGPQALEVSALGYGCMGLSHAYGAALSDAEARTVLDSALDAGYTFFDTAEVYGTESNHHHNEDLLGKILGPKRQQVVLASKFGLTFDLSSTEKMPYPLIIDCALRPFASLLMVPCSA